MALTKTPICDFGKKADYFELKSIDNKIISLNDVKGENGTLIMFICNHCPYVLAVIKNVVEDCKDLENDGIKSLAIMSNDPKRYEEDSFDNMVKFSKNHNFNFPYVIDETQEVAKTYGAVCTPDFFGYNAELELLYRGRFDDRKTSKQMSANSSDLFKGMIEIARTGKAPLNQIPSVGCSIKWKGSE